MVCFNKIKIKFSCDVVISCFSKRQEKLWLEREAQAQIAFKKMREREEKKEIERLEQEVGNIEFYSYFINLSF